MNAIRYNEMHKRLKSIRSLKGSEENTTRRRYQKRSKKVQKNKKGSDEQEKFRKDQGKIRKEPTSPQTNP